MGIILFAIWLILFGLVEAAVISLSSKFLGFAAIVVGIVLIVEHFRS